MSVDGKYTFYLLPLIEAIKAKEKEKTSLISAARSSVNCKKSGYMQRHYEFSKK